MIEEGAHHGGLILRLVRGLGVPVHSHRYLGYRQGIIPRKKKMIGATDPL